MSIKIQIAARTDVGLVRKNNEDNFTVGADLSQPKMGWDNNAVADLGPKGALLVVADGMGGMNAGEVASQVAIDTIHAYFAPERITPEVTKNRISIESFMNKAIEQADKNVKKYAHDHPESKGMGTTIVIAWLFGGKLYVSWCGDSRAYVYSPVAGLHQISKDHSYVQRLVDQGAITRDEAFDYPESNIITRSLCDSTPLAKPESLFQPYTPSDGDIILLCSDGLSGMIRDGETEEIIKECPDDMAKLVDNLIKAACDAAGADNVTVVACRIVEGAPDSDPAYFVATENYLEGRSPKRDPMSTARNIAPASAQPRPSNASQRGITEFRRAEEPSAKCMPSIGPGQWQAASGAKRKALIYVLIALVVVLAAALCYLLFAYAGEPSQAEQPQPAPAGMARPEPVRMQQMPELQPVDSPSPQAAEPQRPSGAKPEAPSRQEPDGSKPAGQSQAKPSATPSSTIDALRGPGAQQPQTQPADPAQPVPQTQPAEPAKEPEPEPAKEPEPEPDKDPEPEPDNSNYLSI